MGQETTHEITDWDERDRQDRAAAQKIPWLRRVLDRRWKDPLTLRTRAKRALETLRARDYPRELWAARHAVIVDALSAHALASHGREHWLTKP